MKTKAVPEPQDEKQIIRKATIKAADILGLTQKELGEILGLSETSVSRFYHNAKLLEPHTKEWELALIFLKIYRSLDTLFGGFEDQCRLWINNFNHHLAGTPRNMLKDVQGIVSITNYLDSMRGFA